MHSEFMRKKSSQDYHNHHHFPHILIIHYQISLIHALSVCFCIAIRLQSLMSIYSGFPTRRDEEKYNSLLGKLLTTLQQHLLTLLGPQISQKHTRTYTKIISRMRDYEEHKYLPPKFSELLAPLCKALGVEELIDKKAVPVDAEEDQRRIKASSRSLHKPRFNTALEHLSEASKRPDFVARAGDQHEQNQALGIQLSRPLFQSSSSKLSRPKTLKGIFPANHRVELAEQYEEPLEETEQWQSFQKGRAAVKGSGRLRYRAFQALQEAQNNLSKRNIPLREDMRRKLKTEDGGGGRQSGIQ